MRVGHKSYFVWNDVDCRSMGVLTAGPAPIVWPEERVKHVTIPGLSGDLTEIEGDNVYNSYIQTVTIHVRGAYRAREIKRWLRGSGYVTFSGEPDKRQKARVIGAVTLNRHSRNLDWWSGEVQFYCYPLKEALAETWDAVTASGQTIRNSGDVISRPVYKITLSDTTCVLTVAGDGLPDDNSITVTDMVVGATLWIDTEALGVWNDDQTVLLTRYSSGDFPLLAPGVNTVTGSGWSRIEIAKRERFL